MGRGGREDGGLNRTVPASMLQNGVLAPYQLTVHMCHPRASNKLMFSLNWSYR